jgi:hypothetical protein
LPGLLPLLQADVTVAKVRAIGVFRFPRRGSV